LVGSDEFDASHLVFINQCLRDLHAQLASRGAVLVTRRGRMPDVLERLQHDLAGVGEISRIWSHEETGNRLTYDRDLRVAAWCRARNVTWREVPQSGVVRRLRDRDGWSENWTSRMDEPLCMAPRRIPCVAQRAALTPGEIAAPSALGLPPAEKSDAQAGGEGQAMRTLNTFLTERGVNYRQDMSSPVTAWDGCSRLSAYLAWGAISMRTIHQRLGERQAVLRQKRQDGALIDRRWLGSLASYQGRLRWHCHFMQKLEDQPDIEFENMNRAYDGLREDGFRDDFFIAWQRGETGYPMVDACMRALHHSGWINFRMRAMLVSFASYDLWLHWRPCAVFLARHFLDFEPGIHFSQFQMQSGVTGINTIRIYNPTKQAHDHDPDGSFIRRYVPELAGVPTAFIAAPWQLSGSQQRASGCIIGRDYPAPIVDHAAAVQSARKRIYAVRRRPETKAEAAHVYQRHGSRRRPPDRGRLPAGA
jgi:deoxyribodipyrimidine photo-lyase